MAIYLPRPFEDELFNGLVFRYIFMLCVKSYSHFRGVRHMARGLHPSKLITLDWWSEQARSGLGLSSTDLARRHTTLPFFSAVRTRRDSMETYEKIEPSYLKRTLHIPNQLRFCSECFREDRVIGRHPYWRRSHQLPGALFCHIHKILLHQTRDGLEGVALYDIETAEETGVQFELDATDAQRANIIGVARLTNWILENRSAYCATLGESRHFCEYIVPGREPRRTSVSPNAARSRYLAHYGESYIDACAVMFGATGVAQIKRGRRFRYVTRANMDLFLLHAMLGQSWNLAWPKCINAAATHGPDHRVSAVTRLQERWAAICECGCTFEYRRVPIEAGVRFEVTAMKLPNAGE
jgi:hypothetical protein